MNQQVIQEKAICFYISKHIFKYVAMVVAPCAIPPGNPNGGELLYYDITVDPDAFDYMDVIAGPETSEEQYNFYSELTLLITLKSHRMFLNGQYSISEKVEPEDGKYRIFIPAAPRSQMLVLYLFITIP